MKAQWSGSLVLLLLAYASSVAAEEPRTADPSARSVSTDTGTASTLVRPNRPLLYAGVAIFAGSYTASAVVAGVSELDADKRLWLPFVGPWLDMAERPCRFGECGVRGDVDNALLALAGLLQSTGLAVAIASLVVPEKQEWRTPSPHVRVLPLGFRAGAGLGAMGSF